MRNLRLSIVDAFDARHTIANEERGTSVRAQPTLLMLCSFATLVVLLTSPAFSNESSEHPENAFDSEKAIKHNHYWIVSSRSCPQRLCDVRSTVKLGYTECCPSSGNRQLKTVSEFRKSFDPTRPICIFIHGSFFSNQDAINDARMTERWLRKADPERRLQVVYYTWPSEGRYSFVSNNPLTSPVPQIDVGILGRRAEFNGFYLAQLIASLPSKSQISLVGHSHGTRVTSSALHLLAGGCVQGRSLPVSNDPTQRIRVVLAAAAIDHDWLNPGERYGLALWRADQLVSMRNHLDAVISIYPLRRPFSGFALGQVGFRRNDIARMGELAVRVSEIDASPMIAYRHFWRHYLRFPELAQSIAPFVLFSDLNVEGDVVSSHKKSPVFEENTRLGK
ncbi:MAG: hypothetical protein CMJ78_27300 [Planctomycetaceae bacterium]|nr:hypothetical protein [Planctomycetaceae bacterium]